MVGNSFPMFPMCYQGCGMSHQHPREGRDAVAPETGERNRKQRKEGSFRRK